MEQLRSLYNNKAIAWEPMKGATSADLYLVRSDQGQHVLRVFKQERWEIPAGALSIRESTILEALRSSDLPTPEPIATLPDNGVLMSWLPGSVELPERPDEQWLEALAGCLERIHRTSIQVPYEYESWNDTADTHQPEWWQDGDLWLAAQTATVRVPNYEAQFVHRDYHPVNVLWDQGRISGIVDWINACMGPAGIDVAHCRLNLAIMYGLQTANDFLEAYTACQSGYVHDPYWDLDVALGALPDVKPYPPWAVFGLIGLTTELVRTRLLEFIRAAVNNPLAK